MKTKKGFGGLLKAGLKCEIVKQDTATGKVVIRLTGAQFQNSIYHGNFNDLEKI